LGKLQKSSARARSGNGTSPCAECEVRPFNICKVLLGREGAAQLSRDGRADWQAHKKIAANKIIKAVGEQLDRVYVVCAGWAFRFAQVPNGRRQILSILVPGDVITPTRPFEDVVSFSVQALTDVRYCGYSRALLKERLATETPLVAAWTDLIVAERKQNFDLLIDLGSLSAEERVADFVVQLVTRLEQRPALVEDPLIIPLPQWLIAAALGLTPEYVSRVISTFRQERVIESRRGLLRVIDPHSLRRIVGLRA